MEHIEPEPPEPSRGKFAPWQTVLIVIATWLASSLVNWGVMQERQQDMVRRLDSTDQEIAKQVPRAEFDGWRQEMDRRLERMEEKLDALLVKQ